MPLSRYLKIYPCPEKPGSYLLYSTRKGSVVRVSDTLLTAARAGTLTEAERQRLSALEIVVDDPAAEREAMSDLVRRANARRNRVKATAVLNLDCNLACPYCYEDRFRGKKYMSPETARLLVKHVVGEQMDRGREVGIDFYGGEPLLSLSLLKEIARPLRQAADSRGTRFSFHLVTNGTLLTRAVVDELLPLGLAGAQVTLDGPRDVHDRQRPFVSGNGSFDTIAANIAAGCDLISLQITGNYTRENFREFPRLLDHFLAQGITPEKLRMVQFSPVMPKSGRTAGPDTAGGCIATTEPWVAEAAPFLRGETLRRGFASYKPTMAACAIEFEKDFIVKYDGTLYKCPVFMGYPELCVGTLADGITDYAVSHNLALWQNDECLDCAYLPLCFGGCRFLTYQRTGAMDEVDCRRAFLDACLEEFVRQDLESSRGHENADRT
jgi:uncharacterized protein